MAFGGPASLRTGGHPARAAPGWPGRERHGAGVIDEAKPLAGRRVVVTRPRAQASEFIGWLQARGAEVVAFPAIRLVDPPDPGPLARAAAQVRSFDWLVFTSVNGVERFWTALAAARLDGGAVAGARVAAIGPATAAALRERGVEADVVPERYVAEAVVDALAAAGDLRARRVLLPRAAGAREVLPERLRQLGAVVTEVEAYRAVADASEATDLRRRLTGGDIDAVTFTSSSTVRNFVEAVGTEIGGAAVACIGPITAETARELGLPATVVAEEHTIPGLEAALLELFGAGREQLPGDEA